MDCDSLAIFDFDDTLVTSDSEVIVNKSDGSSQRLAPSQYAVYQQEPGDEFDFSEFDEVRGAQPTPIFNILRKMVQECGVDSVLILTARHLASKNALHDFFSDELGVNLVGIETVGTTNSSAKANKVRDYVMRLRPKDVHFWDDTDDNLQALGKMARTSPDFKGIAVNLYPVAAGVETGDAVVISERQLRRIIRETMEQPIPQWPEKHFAWRNVVFTKDGDVRYILDVADPETVQAAIDIGEPFLPGTNVIIIKGAHPGSEKVYLHDSDLLDLIQREGWSKRPPPPEAKSGFWDGKGNWSEDPVVISERQLQRMIRSVLQEI